MQVSQRQFDRQNTLTISQLECIRDDRVLFEGLNFELKAGELLQIEGHNGSGKTSLLRILCGLSLPESGQIFWQQQDIEEDKAVYWENLSYIGHAPGVKGELTPIENLRMAKALGSQPTDISLESALEQVGLYGFEDVPTRTLSAGQQRRVALARLLTNDVQLWILDEPFTALDKKAIQMVESLLDQHAQRGGMAVITSHHHVNCEYARILKLA
ncbi:cytochrome c biogenesis heme-transporting ATPase CcmA [Candidatus Albibeggiatoa sp. nov. NOAA]|uniref:cytochrome c biogenesis heme-transporting ATPase CcmA n=1 Tax=Candidatus Albibeggiatoa sp. nov. NOAA TaxID=3162724 RepID=UPI0032FE1141|nr:cytochrome c biogenesis heme-transporting ATPase CcmA [Thiotrichaceae bacterium]